MLKNTKEKELITREFEGTEIVFEMSDEGQSFVRIDEVAKFCGWTTVAKSGNECIRWSRVNEKLNLLGVANVGNGDFIPENIMYPLIGMADFKKNPKAREFMLWVGQVLTELRQYGVVQIREDIDEDYLRFNVNAINKTFSETSIEGLVDTYKECMNWIKDTKYRIQYSPNSNKRKGAMHKQSDTKLIIMGKIVDTLETRNKSLAESGKFGLISEIDNVIKSIKDDVKTLNNRISGGKLASANREIKILKGQVDELTKENERKDTVIPSEGEYVTLDIHGMSNNYMYEHKYGKTVRTTAYNHWIRDFHNLDIPSKLEYELFNDIDFDKPIALYIKYVCKPENDIRNFDKSFIDQLFNNHFRVDDNIVDRVVSERVGSCNRYEDGKIMFAIRNM